MITACFAGLVAGLLHVFAGPDHLAALAPLAVRAQRRAWSVGLRWGLGHAAGVALVAAVAFGLRQVIALDAIAGWGERLVGATMIVLGLWGLRALFKERLHVHPHRHGPEGEHAHYHVHAQDQPHEAPESHVHRHAAFWVGSLHGLAGSAHLFGILPSFALPTAGETGGFLGMYGIGTLVAMVVFATVLGWLSPQRTERGMRAYRWVLGGASGICAATGVAWIVLPLLDVPLP